MKDIVYINNQTLKQNRLIADQDCLLPSAYDSRCSFYIENTVLKSYLKCPSLTLEKDRFGIESNRIFFSIQYLVSSIILVKFALQLYSLHSQNITGRL